MSEKNARARRLKERAQVRSVKRSRLGARGARILRDESERPVRDELALARSECDEALRVANVEFNLEVAKAKKGRDGARKAAWDAFEEKRSSILKAAAA